MTDMYRIVILILACAFVGGCSKSPEGPATALATGTVTYKGVPVSGAVVVFRPSDSASDAKASESGTDEEGSFAMQTSLGVGEYKAGIVPGDYAVEIRKVEPPPDFTGPPRSVLPAKYASAQTSGFKATVKAGEDNDFKFELTD